MMRCHLKAKARTAVGCFLPLAICSWTKSLAYAQCRTDWLAYSKKLS